MIQFVLCGRTQNPLAVVELLRQDSSVLLSDGNAMSEVKPKRGRRERASRTQGSGKGSSKGNTASPIAKVENSSAEQGSWSKGSRVFAARERPDRNQQLQPGMVLLRGWLTMDQQQELVDATFVHGEGDDHVRTASCTSAQSVRCRRRVEGSIGSRRTAAFSSTDQTKVLRPQRQTAGASWTRGPAL